jgi:hypothetical protein
MAAAFSVSQTKQTTTKHMKRNSYYPTNIAGQILWLTNFANKAPGLATTLGLTPAVVTALVADCLWLIYLLQEWLPAARRFSGTGTTAINEAEFGDGTALMVLPVFTAPALPTGAAAVNTGALNRIFALVQSLKDSGKCSDTNASILGITGTAQSGPDYTTLQPVLTLVISGNQVFVKWNWGGYSGFLGSCEIWVDRGDGKGFVFLTIDTTPGYNDTQAFPTARTVWTYRAIYRVGEQQVGLWSQSVSTAVPA